MDTMIFSYLLAVKEQGNISKAAEKMFISQSAVSQQLAKIQKELGVKIFEKKEGILIPTSAGKIVLRTAEQVLNVERDMEDRIKKLMECQ